MILFGSTSFSQVREEQGTKMTNKQVSNSKPLQKFWKTWRFLHYKFNLITELFKWMVKPIYKIP